MPYVEMVIDSIRHAMHKDEWVILLKEKSGQRYLPVYVDKACADMMGKVLKGKVSGEILDDEIADDETFREMEKVLGMADSASLMIDGFEDGVYHASFNVDWGNSVHNIEYPVGNSLTLAVKTGIQIWAEEKLFEVALLAEC